MGLIDWLLERLASEHLDRARLEARTVLDNGRLGFLCANHGKNATSINGVGYRVSDGTERDLRVREELPIPVPGKSEVLLHIDDILRIPVTVAVLRKEGKSIAGFWIRQMGMEIVDVSTHPDVLATINDSPEPGPFSVVA